MLPGHFQASPYFPLPFLSPPSLPHEIPSQSISRASFLICKIVRDRSVWGFLVIPTAVKPLLPMPSKSHWDPPCAANINSAGKFEASWVNLTKLFEFQGRVFIKGARRYSHSTQLFHSIYTALHIREGRSCLVGAGEAKEAGGRQADP